MKVSNDDNKNSSLKTKEYVTAMKNIKLSTRIYAQQIIVLLTLIGMGFYALSTMMKIDHSIVVTKDEYYPVLSKMLHIQEMEAEEEIFFIEEMRLGTAIQLDTGNSEIGNRYRSVRQEREKVTKELVAEINKTIGDIEKFIQIEGLSAQEVSELNGMLGKLKQVSTNHEDIVKCMEEIERKLDASASILGMEKEIVTCIEDMNANFKAVEELTVSVDHSVSEHISSIQVSADNFTNTLMIIVAAVSCIAILMTILTGMALSALRKSVFTISGSVQQVATAAAQSSNAISMVSDGAKTQTESINQAVTAVEQSVSVLSEVSSSSEKATEIAKFSGQAVMSGKEKMLGMVQVVGRIQDNSNKVNKITEIISGIASQTNMLALNAAIEAARAGEQGKGFAVVADQVKSLAESSKNSVDEIVELIEQAKLDAAEAVKVAQMVSGEMEKIEDGVKKTEQMMQSISTAMEEQVSTTEELSHNMDTLRDIGTSNANAAEEITETIMELSRISNETNDELKKFNI
jgi:methyl-accepting chemotaxis protein